MQACSRATKGKALLGPHTARKVGVASCTTATEHINIQMLAPTTLYYNRVGRLLRIHFALVLLSTVACPGGPLL